MAVLSTQRRKPFFRALVAVICFVFIAFFLGLNSSDGSASSTKHSLSHGRLPNLGMGEGECLRTFPGLMKEVDLSVQRLAGNRFELEKSSDDTSGLVEGRIKNNKVRICQLPQCCVPIIARGFELGTQAKVWLVALYYIRREKTKPRHAI